MSTGGQGGRSPVDVSVQVLGAWKKTYEWIPIFGGLLAFATAFSTGANNIPIPCSTLVGSGTVTLVQASLVAWFINVPGTTFASNTTVDPLFSHFLQQNQPNEGFMMWSLVIVLITTTLWLALATYLELPVSTQLSMQSALLGTMLVTRGMHIMPIHNKDRSQHFSVLRVTLEWMAAPSIAGLVSFAFYGFLKLVVLRQEDAGKKILIFLPIYYAVSVGLLCLFLMYQVIPYMATIESWMIPIAVISATIIAALLSLIVVVPLARKRLDEIEKSFICKKIGSPNLHSLRNLSDEEPTNKIEDEEEADFEKAMKNYMEMRVLNTVYEEDERNCVSPEIITDSEGLQDKSTSLVITSHSTPFKQLLESTPNQLVQTRNFQKIQKTTKKDEISKLFRDLKNTTLFPAMEYDRHTLIRHALAEKYDEKMEELFSFPHILASCIFAFTQSANEIASVVSPYGVILDIYHHREKYSGDSDVGSVQVIWWIRALGGFGASLGFFLCGWRLTQCLGGKLTYMSNSRGLSSQLCALATVMMATSMKLPVSSSHSFVGSLLGVGIADDPRNVNWKLFLKFLCGWILTPLFCCGVAYCVFSFTIHSPGYVVP